MKILCFGSINIDHVYSVPHFVQPGETLATSGYRTFAGGKGLNQSIALARAGAEVWHAGKVGAGAEWILNHLRRAGVDTSLVATGEIPTGHAIIQVAADGQNCILLFAGANHSITPADVNRALAEFGPGDFLVLQNEINGIPDLIRAAKARGLRVALNPAPMTAEVSSFPLDLLDYLIVNEVEGAGLTGQSEPEAIIAGLEDKFPAATIVLTLGRQGVICSQAGRRFSVPAKTVKAVDTTAAGDTFSGYFIAELARGRSIEEALATATAAAAICVTRPGAAESIPTYAEVIQAANQSPS